MNRRQILLASSVLLATSALASCAAGNAGIAVAANDVAIIVSSLQATVPVIAAAAGITPANAATLTTALADIQSAAAGLSSAASSSVNASKIAQIETDLNAIIAVAASLPLIPPEVTLALQAAEVLIPVIEAAIGMIISPTPTARRKLLPPTTMSPNKARAILKALVVT